MTIPERRYTGFNDPTGLQIFEGDYLILKLSDLSPEQLAERNLTKLIPLYDLQYMQVYIKPTGELRYELDMIVLDSKHKPLTEAQHQFSHDNDGMTEEEFLRAYGKDSSLTEIYTSFIFYHFRVFKAIVADNLWFKGPALFNRENAQ